MELTRANDQIAFLTGLTGEKIRQQHPKEIPEGELEIPAPVVVYESGKENRNGPLGTVPVESEPVRPHISISGKAGVERADEHEEEGKKSPAVAATGANRDSASREQMLLETKAKLQDDFPTIDFRSKVPHIDASST